MSINHDYIKSFILELAAHEGKWRLWNGQETIFTTLPETAMRTIEVLRDQVEDLEAKLAKAFEINLHWVHEATPKGKPIGKYLMMGDIELVCLRPRAKWWQTIHWLPIRTQTKEYGPLELQMEQAEATVKSFFKHGGAKPND